MDLEESTNIIQERMKRTSTISLYSACIIGTQSMAHLGVPRDMTLVMIMMITLLLLLLLLLPIKDVAVIAQTKRKMCQMKHASQNAKLSTALSSKNERLKSMIKTVETFQSIGMSEKAAEMAEKIPLLMEELRKLEDAIENLKEDESAVDTEAPVDLFIQRGSEAMGVKKAKSKSNTTATSTDDEKDDDDNDDVVICN